MNKVKERIKIGQYWLVDADIQMFFMAINKPQVELYAVFISRIQFLREP